VVKISEEKIMIDPITLAKLIEFGMTEREAKLYLALLEAPEVSAAELNRKTGILRTKIYEALEQMVVRGFCHERLSGRKRYYRAVSPVDLHASMVSKWEHDIDYKRNLAKETFKELGKLYKEKINGKSTLEIVKVLHNAEQVHQQYMKLNSEAEFEVLTFNRSPYACVVEGKLEEEEEIVEDVCNRELILRTIYMVEDEHWDWLYGHITRSHKMGEEFRISTNLPMKMFIFDRRKVMFAVPSDPVKNSEDFSMIIIDDTGFAESCRITFEKIWNDSFTLEEWEKQK